MKIDLKDSIINAIETDKAEFHIPSDVIGFAKANDCNATEVQDIKDMEFSLSNIPAVRYHSPIKVVFDEGVEEIPEDFFYGTSCISEVVFPNSVISIGKGAFDGSSIKKITWGDDPRLTNLGPRSFASCPIKECSVPNKVKVIPKFCFSGCTKLETADMPSVEEIGSHAFDECSSLETINAPVVIKIGNYGFKGCSLKEYVAPPTLSRIGASAFRSCLLETIDLSKCDLNEIERYTFRDNCLSKIIFPEVLFEVKEEAFANNELSNETIEQLGSNYGVLIAKSAFLHQNCEGVRV